jgi:hypothetical protein
MMHEKTGQVKGAFFFCFLAGEIEGTFTERTDASWCELERNEAN